MGALPVIPTVRACLVISNCWGTEYQLPRPFRNLSCHFFASLAAEARSSSSVSSGFGRRSLREITLPDVPSFLAIKTSYHELLVEQHVCIMSFMNTPKKEADLTVWDADDKYVPDQELWREIQKLTEEERLERGIW